ncbi:hypothetical protein BvRS1_08940 [Burkholderia vietnamiensis]|nr:hypothetical protein BvRS1_08940 [Burkholderia vietnamiensis]
MLTIPRQVRLDHHLAELLQRRLRRPAELGLRLVRAADQQIDLGGAVELRIHFDEHVAVRCVEPAFLLALAGPFDLVAGRRERHLHEVAHGLGAVGCEHVGVGLVDLQHPPHPFDVFERKAPVAFRVEVAELELVRVAERDLRDGVGDLARDELAAAQRRFVIEQDAAAAEQPVRLAIVDRHPVRVQLRDAVRAARVKRGRFRLRNRLHLAEHLGRRRLIEARFRAHHADRLEQVQRADAGHLGGRRGLIERHADEALRGQVVQLVRLRAFEQPQARAGLGQIVFDERQVRMRGDAEFRDAPEVHRARATVGARYFVALVEQQLGQIGAVLPGDPRDDGLLASLAHGNVLVETMD